MRPPFRRVGREGFFTHGGCVSAMCPFFRCSYAWACDIILAGGFPPRAPTCFSICSLLRELLMCSQKRERSAVTAQPRKRAPESTPANLFRSRPRLTALHFGVFNPWGP